MRGRWIIAAFALAAFAAQHDAGAGKISGVVRDAATGAPVEGAAIYLDFEPQNQSTDALGRYTLAKVPAGQHYVLARARTDVVHPVGEGEEGRGINITDGEKIALDLPLARLASLEGTVLDANRRPAKGLMVTMSQRTYETGLLDLAWVASAVTDEDGVYHFHGVPAGEPLLLLAGRLKAAAPDSASNGALAPVDTYYPHSTSPETAEEVTLSPGEIRRRADIRLVELENYCVSGVVKGAGKGVDVYVQVAPEVALGRPDAALPATPNGEFRVCGLPSAQYRLYFQTSPAQSAAPRLYASQIVSINRADVSGVRAVLQEPREVPCDIVWGDDAAAPTGYSATVMFQSPFGLMPIQPPLKPGRMPTAPTAEPPEDYQITGSANGKGVVIKDIVAGGLSVFHRTVHPPVEDLRVILGRGVNLSVQTVDSGDHPLAYANIAVAPAETATEAEFAARAVFDHADQHGAWTSRALLPGRYLVFATFGPLDEKAFHIDQLWAARAKATLIELKPNTPAQVRVNVQDLASH